MPPTIATYNYAPAPCMPCMETAPIPYGCFCALLIPPGEAAYANYNTANAAIQNQTANCIGYISPNRTSFTANFSSATQVDFSANVPSSNHNIWFSGAFQANSSITANFAINSLDGNNSSSMTAKVFSYYCNGELAGSNIFNGNTGVNISGSLTGITLPVAGEYVFLMQSFGYSGANNVVSTWNVTSNSNLVVNPVIANWQDGDNVRMLWACPKLFLPILTENTGEWYSNCASANTVLTDTLQVSGCVGYAQDQTGFQDSFTATNGGSSLSFSATTNSPAGGMGPFWGCVNAVSGETLSIAWTAFSNATVVIYKDDGVSFETIGSGSSPITSSTLPYTGRYTISVTLFSPPPGFPQTSSSATITSSGLLSINQISALYDSGLSCPEHLVCGDTCP